jgi:cystathionine beta-lyase
VQQFHTNATGNGDNAIKYDFDKIHKRTGTGSLKWDYVYHDGELVPRHAGQDPLIPTEMLPMWLADQDFQTAQPIIDAIVGRARHGIFGYTAPGTKYLKAITDWMDRRYDWPVNAAWITTVSGVVPAINHAIQAFTAPGDKVLIQSPVFHPFAQSIENNERIVVRNSLQFTGSTYNIDFDDLEKCARDPGVKLMIFCSPHNPVGRVWSTEELCRLGQICKQNDVLLVSDEIHCDVTYSWANFTTLGRVDETLHEQLIVLGSPSKAFNLPGLKTAYAIIPDHSVREQFVSAQENMNELFGANIFGTLAIQTAYESGGDWLQQMMAYLESNYLYLGKFLAEHAPELKLVKSDALYLAWIDCRNLYEDPAELESFFRDDAGIILDSGRTYGPEGAGFMRMNIACSRRILETALERIRTALLSRPDRKN